jgi:O-antigen/teichoic acid export membrane protein
MKIKEFFLQTDHIDRDSFVWNMAGSMLLAFQSVIMLMVLTRVLGLADAGIFTIAYANANLFLTIGKYGMRNFQVSDVNGQFTFYEYLMSRIFTVSLMIAVSIVFVVYVGNKNGYSMEKSLIIIWMSLFKVVDAFEDVFHGLYQQRGRLDIAGKAMTLRLGTTILFFLTGLLILKNLLIVLIFITCFTGILLIVFTRWSYKLFERAVEKRYSFYNVLGIIKICFPLFLGSFLSFYIGNAPKYAIDGVLNDELQACYGFIAMPVFVIGLLNNFVFNPMIYKMSVLWDKGKKNEFLKKFIIQVMIVIGITLVCIVGAYLVGIPILSFLYNTDLSLYKYELLILLLGGGFLALSGLLVTVITIIRFQNSLMFGYIIVSILAYTLSKIAVEQYSIRGAAGLYAILTAALCFLFFIFLGYGLKRKEKFT